MLKLVNRDRLFVAIRDVQRNQVAEEGVGLERCQEHKLRLFYLLPIEVFASQLEVTTDLLHHLDPIF